MSEAIELVGIAGSLRKKSFNRALLRTLVELAPPDTKLAIVELDDIPLYNGDLESDELRPDSVKRLKNRIQASHGLVLVSPEYNYGVPGVLKNALDWASRPAFRSPLLQKPVSLFGASTSAVGTARSQSQLVELLHGTASLVFPAPEFLLANAKEKFDSDLRLDHEPTRELARTLLGDFATFVRRAIAGGVAPAPRPDK